jgi:hypothetical protein
MNQSVRDMLPVLLFIAASYNGIMMTVFAWLFLDVRSRLERLENHVMEVK